MRRGRRSFVRIVVVTGLVGTSFALLPQAHAAGNCGVSESHTICVSVPDGSLSGDVTVTVTNSPNKGTVVVSWIPNGTAGSPLIWKAAPSPTMNNTYSFVWPTRKYLDGPGTLRVQHGTTAQAPVDLAVTLANGNATDFQHTPNDWMNYLPGAYTGPTDPVVPVVGDGASDEKPSDAVANAIAALDPPLMLYLGDVYDAGTFTENRNHYGISSMDVPGGGTLWGSFADVTQTTNGNHEAPHPVDFADYWHGRPLYTKFTFGGVLFLDMNSNNSLGVTSAQYRFVQSAITSPTAPSCIVAFQHHPIATNNGSVRESNRAFWQLMANNGVDLLLTGHTHLMAEFKPMDASFAAGTQDAHLVQLISGSGGHAMASDASYQPGSSIAWSKGKVPGYAALTLQGAANGGTATSLGWAFKDTLGNVLRTGSVGCGNRPPTVAAGPDQQVTLPAQAALQGTASDDGQPAPPSLTTTWTEQSGPGTVAFDDASAPVTNATFSDPGVYVLRLTASDGLLSSFDELTVSVDPAGTVVVDLPIATSRDDAEESATGTMSVTSTDLELVHDVDDQLVGLRFVNVPIPHGATIDEAWVQFEVDEKSTGPISLTVQGQAADNPVTFSSGSGRISTRARTVASVPWSPPDWNTVQVHGADQRTPDLSPVLDEIVGRPLWTSGNALVLIISGTGKRTAEAWDGTYAPVLHVKYSP